MTLALCWDSLFQDATPPDSICFYFYPLNGDLPFKFVCNNEHARQTIPNGEYQVLVFNCDLQQIQFLNMEKYETAEAVLCTQSKAENIIPETGMLYGAAIDYFSVNKNCPAQQTIVPEKLVQRLSFSVNLGNIADITECKGNISGMSACMNLSQKKPLRTEQGIVPFQTNRTEKGVEASLFVFGTCSRNDDLPPPPNLVNLDFTFTDGTTSSAQADLTPLLQSTEHKDVVVSIDPEKDLAGNIVLKATISPWINGGNTDTDIH